ncbi:unnamed protein product [Blepharisma stoltei]|uniref:Calponin-homology (CH) domain-containing protein n=1 Tax=Blepharisma stoltei TaxID=1481888 RepID=A0AAU9JNS4_9CILI|nr:unnamed protein product [Blepharisma stoltei]
MDDISYSLIQWLNKMNLSHQCQKLSELSDGILLYELMAKLSPDYFDIDSITLDAHDNWALKLANLRRLKKAIDSYLDQILQTPHDRFGEIDFANIARKDSISDLVNLMELIVFTILKSPQKENFIHPIMTLDEKCQTQLMFFIQKILGNDLSSNPPPPPETERQEVHILRHEKKRLTYKIQAMQEELSKLASQHTEIASERDELKVMNTNLESELVKKSPSILSPDITFVELESKISEKEGKLTVIQEELKETKKKYENEIARLRDEVDIADSNNIRLQQAEKSLQQYKKKCENMVNASKKLSEVSKQNDYLQKKINSMEEEINDFNKISKAAGYLKEQLGHEKEKSESLSFANENKDKQIKQLTKQINELEEKLIFAENKVQELVKGAENGSNVSDDSFGYHKVIGGLGEESNELSKNEHKKENKFDLHRSSSMRPPFEHLDLLAKEKIIIQEKCEKYKIKCKSKSEGLKMLQEDFSSYRLEKEKTILDLKEKARILKMQGDTLRESLANGLTDKVKMEQLQYEYEKLKTSKEGFLQEIKKLHEEKDLMYRHFIECREETIVLQNAANDKEIKIREKSLNEKLLYDKINELAEKERVSMDIIESLKKQKQEVNEDYHIKFIELERELITEKSEKASLILRLNDKDQRIEEILKDKAETIKILEEEHHEVLDRLKYENDRKVNQMITQTEEALNELQNERELLAAKLKFLKNNTINELTKANTAKEIQGYLEEIAKLKEKLEQKERDNIDLIKSNKELKQCWKESAKLLKHVWRELGIETQKLETATQRRRAGISILQ